MLIKDKDILASDAPKELNTKVNTKRIDKNSMKSAWGDIFDYYLRGITEKYLNFHGRATRLEFWGFLLVSCFIMLPLYFLGDYIDIVMLPYYYLAATFIPLIAVTVRRFHDIYRNSLIYITVEILCVLSALFIGWWAIIPVLCWSAFLVHLLSEETNTEVDIYGEVCDDETYGDDSIQIIKKFRLYAVILIFILLGVAYLRFDDWSKQIEYSATNHAIFDQIEEMGQKQGMSPKQIEFAKELMKQTLKQWNGQEVQPEDITKAINFVLKGAEGQKSK